MDNPNAGARWVLLRGLARESGHWGPFLGDFQSRFAGDSVWPVDLPGVGEFRNLASPRSIREILSFVRDQVIAKGGRGPLRVVAVSMGGMIAMEWMRRFPGELGSCVLINTSARALSPFYYRLRWQVWREFARVVSLQSARERERAIIEILMNSEEARRLALPLWTKLATEHPISYMTFMSQLWAAAQYRGGELPSATPVLLLNGLGDRLVDPSCSEMLHKQFQWELRRHPWGGHDLPWDAGAWVLDQIEEWSQSVGIAATAKDSVGSEVTETRN